jgi:chromosome segregation ATPase
LVRPTRKLINELTSVSVVALSPTPFQINEIKGSIRKFNQEGDALEKQRKLAMGELEERLTISKAQAKAYSEKQAALSQQLGVLKAGIEAIFNSPVCDRSVLAHMLGNTEVTEANIMQFLGAVEQRTNELLQLRALLDQKEKEKWELKETELREQLEDDSEFDPTATLVSVCDGKRGA